MLKVTKFYKDNPPWKHSLSFRSTSEKVSLCFFFFFFKTRSPLGFIPKGTHGTSNLLNVFGDCSYLHLLPLSILPWVLLILSFVYLPSYLFFPLGHNHTLVLVFTLNMCLKPSENQRCNFEAHNHPASTKQVDPAPVSIAAIIWFYLCRK